jgi:hypothetical protein
MQSAGVETRHRGKHSGFSHTQKKNENKINKRENNNIKT